MTRDEGRADGGARAEPTVSTPFDVERTGYSASGACGTGAFCGLGDECDPLAGRPPRCEGDAMVTCIAERLDRVDCPSLGFEACAPEVRRGAHSLFSEGCARMHGGAAR